MRGGESGAEKNLSSDEHLAVDGTLIEAWASLKSFHRLDEKNPPLDGLGNLWVDFHAETRSNDTQESKTDPDAMLARKGNGKETKLSYNGNLLVANRNGLTVTTELFQANGTAERDAALVMLEQIPGDDRAMVRADKAYDTAGFVAEYRNLTVKAPVAQNTKRTGESASMSGPRGPADTRSARGTGSGPKRASGG